MPDSTMVQRDPHVARAPTWPIFGTATCVSLSVAIVAAELTPLRESMPVSLAGYLLATLVAAMFVVLHRAKVQSAQRHQYYVARPSLDAWAVRLLAAGLALGLWHAYVLATEIAKRTAS